MITKTIIRINKLLLLIDKLLKSMLCHIRWVDANEKLIEIIDKFTDGV